MSEEHTSDPEATESPGSVFGNLPGSRPGSRSPLREGGSATKAKPKPAAPQETPAPKGQARPEPMREPEREAAPDAQPEGGGGLEDIAWAGVAAAAEAATLGVRLASRAIEALRGNPERD